MREQLHSDHGCLIIGFGGRSRDVDIDTEENNLKQYIDAYQITLRNTLKANNVTTRIGKYQEMAAITGDDGSSQSTLRNPSGIGCFWLGTESGTTDKVYYVYIDGYIQGRHG